MSNKRKQIEGDEQADLQKYTEREYKAAKKENVQLKLAVEDDCDRERDRIADDISQLLVTEEAKARERHAFFAALECRVRAEHEEHCDLYKKAEEIFKRTLER